MDTKWITLETTDGPMRAYLAVPDGAGPFPGVVVLQEAFGVNAYVRSVCDRQADVGFAALAPELFHRQGDHVEVSYDHLPKAIELITALENDAIAGDATAAVAALRARPDVDVRHIGVIGFCIGGFAALLTGLTSPVAAVVAFYPGSVVRKRPGSKLEPILDRLPTMQAATLIHFGGDDQGIPPADVQAVRGALARSHARHEIVEHPGAKHGFHSDDRATAFHPHAAEEAWHQTLLWLRESLG